MKGISFEKARNKWTARTTVDGKRILIGRYDTEQEAVHAHLLHTGVQEVMQYEEHDEGIKWLEAWRNKLKVRLMKKEREAQQKIDAENDRKLEAL